MFETFISTGSVNLTMQHGHRLELEECGECLPLLRRNCPKFPLFLPNNIPINEETSLDAFASEYWEYTILQMYKLK
jgi:hypothetical protein